jgi:bifunctional UDP-N-acetylglucosamine pyrophosphorylase/glucosamine-1-phosphate N-acetyltransferase
MTNNNYDNKPMKNLAVIILAAGRGKRMKSQLPKALHPICGKAILLYVLDLAKRLKPKKIVVVLGHRYTEVKKILPDRTKTVIQRRLLGSADAVKRAKPFLKDFKGSVLVLYADNPLLTEETLEQFVDYHLKNKSDATLLTAVLQDPSGYGRIIRDKSHNICKIVEEKDANDYQKTIKEINTGVMCFNKQKLFSALQKVRLNKIKNEYYLTDVIQVLYQRLALIESLRVKRPEEAKGINSLRDLAEAEKIMQARLKSEFMRKGVRFLAPDTVFICSDTRIGRGTVIYPFTVIERDVKIGKFCSVGPFCHLRQSTVLKDRTVVGNFTEAVRTTIGQDTLVKHFSYLGDSRIGAKVNIGAGTVTANYDGRKKNITVIGDASFIGSDTVLIAPVKVGKRAKTGAGSVVLKNRDIPEGKIVAGVPARLLNK